MTGCNDSVPLSKNDEGEDAKLLGHILHVYGSARRLGPLGVHRIEKRGEERNGGLGEEESDAVAYAGGACGRHKGGDKVGETGDDVCRRQPETLVKYIVLVVALVGGERVIAVHGVRDGSGEEGCDADRDAGGGEGGVAAEADACHTDLAGEDGGLVDEVALGAEDVEEEHEGAPAGVECAKEEDEILDAAPAVKVVAQLVGEGGDGGDDDEIEVKVFLLALLAHDLTLEDAGLGEVLAHPARGEEAAAQALELALAEADVDIDGARGGRVDGGDGAVGARRRA